MTSLSSHVLPPGPPLLTIDATNIVRTIYQAIPIPSDTPEKAEGAIRSAKKSFARALNDHKPMYALAIFDPAGPTWRHRLYPKYREGRNPMPQVLRDALPGFQDWLGDELGLQSHNMVDAEADDGQAALHHRWVRFNQDRGCQAVNTVLSTDKDMTELLQHGARVYNHFKEHWVDEAWVLKKFGVPVAQLQDFLALTGDKSDGIPGVADVGPVTAVKLLTQYGTLENILAHASEVKGVAGKRLLEHAGIARMSRQLVAFKLDIDMGLTWRQLRLSPLTS